MFRKTVLVRALSVAFGAAALTAAVTPTVHAQSSASGTISGQVGTGSSVLIENIDTGAKRTLTPGADGKYQANAMPVGRYKVTVQRAGAAVTTRDVEVVIGGTVDVSTAAGSTSLGAVQIVGARQAIDVTTTGSTTTFSATELQRLPIANNVGAVIQLAPNTTRGDSRYGGANAPSFGGAGASENAYYINGFPVTTLLTQVGFSQLPFNSIANFQVLTGGYSAEFGRSTGGVVNIVTKSGTNDWKIGGGLSWEPKSLRSDPKNQYFDAATGQASAGHIRFYNADNKQESLQESLYFSGPLIKDKLFIFGSLEHTKIKSEGTRIANVLSGGLDSANTLGGWQTREVVTPRALLKLDWNITDQHHLEYTGINDKVEDSRSYYNYNYRTFTRGEVRTGGAEYVNWGPTPTAAAQGSRVNILKYTGYITDDFTVTALVGRTTSDHKSTPSGYNPLIPRVLAPSNSQIPGFNYPILQTTTAAQLVPGAFDSNKGGRLDFEWKINSQHTARIGVDYNKIESTAGSSTAGGSLWTYGKTDPNSRIDRNTVPTSTVTGNPYAQLGYFASQSISKSQSSPTVIQTAAYIEDKWAVTDRLNLVLGLRNEGFDNRNGDNQSYIKLSKQLAPRLGASWDVKGDSTLKVFGNLGRYHVPLPTNAAVRGAGSSLNTTQNFVYTGVDPATGAPTGLTPISPVFSANNEFGQAKNPKEVAAQDMKGNYQDELAFGMESAVMKDLNVGAKFTYRKLRTAIDDHCDDRPFRAWAARNNVDDSHFGYNCALFNPGRANTFTLDIDGDGRLDTVNLSAADLGIPKVKRTYTALDLFAEHPFDGKWWGKVNYTWSKNSGNTEGQLLSDIGQADVSTTQAFDFPEFSANADGRLPNDRKHQIKMFGYYQATPEWGVGGNLLYASGRPKNCIGNAPNIPVQDTAYKPGDPVTDYSTYGSAYFFCGNIAANSMTGQVYVPGLASPRGSQGNLPADVRFDLNISYRPAYVKGLKLQVDIFNLFNRQSVETIEERYNTAGGINTIRETYRAVESYSAPRSVKLSAFYDYQF